MTFSSAMRWVGIAYSETFKEVKEKHGQSKVPHQAKLSFKMKNKQRLSQINENWGKLSPSTRVLQEILNKLLTYRRLYRSQTWFYIKKWRDLKKKYIKEKCKLLFLLVLIDLNNNCLFKEMLARKYLIVAYG